MRPADGHTAGKRISPVLADFAGHWLIDRSIDDLRAGEVRRLDGKALLEPDGDGLCYHEVGTLTLADGRTVIAERRYRWRQEGGRIVVEFADGRLFNAFDPAEARPSVLHLCGPDRYGGQYDLSDWPRWSLAWRVTGPRKDYAMMTFYRRA